MATITTILATDIIAASRVTINTNFSNLNTDKVDVNSTYADPAWITSLAGSKITGSIGGNAATATALATARTIAGVSFDGTANIAIPSSGLSDSADIVRGASSVASGQVLYGTGAGVAGSEANLFWDAANDRLGVGTNTPSSKVSAVVDATTDSGFRVNYTGRTSNLNIQADGADNLYARVSGGRLYLGTVTAGNDFFLLAGSVTSRAVLNGSTGNLLLGTTTDDGTNRLQVAGSARLATTANGTPVALALLATGTGSDATVDTVGSGAYMYLRSTLASPYAGTQINKTTNTVLWFTGTQGLDTYGWFTGSSFTRLASLTTGGTFSLYNETPTTGSTSLVVRAGAGQGSNNLTTWQNSGGTALTAIANDGGVNTFGGYFAMLNSAGSLNEVLIQNNLDFASGRIARWSSTTNATGTKDLSLSRASANTLQVGDGGANALGQIRTRSLGGVNASSVLKFYQFDGTAFLSSDFSLSWKTTTNADGGSVDTGLARNAAGVVEVNNGTAGTFRDLYLRGVRPVGSTVANLPTASGNTGMMATVTDANATTIGTTVAGGGANTVLVWSNGTNWRIYAN
jgi:hypothetical protein